MKKRFLKEMMYVLAAVLCLPAYAVTPAPKNIFSVSEDGKMVEISQTIITGLYQWEAANTKAESDGYRLLTSAEWTYLLVTRDNEDHYNTGMNNLGRIKATSEAENYTNGLIILPDGWIQPEGTTFSCVHTGIAFDKDSNSYSYDQWELMKAAGAVFLPADGYGYNGIAGNEESKKETKDNPDNIEQAGIHGAYWALDAHNTTNAHAMRFDGENGLQIHDYTNQSHYAYYSVLLVKDVNIKLLDELDETTAMTTRLNAARDDASVMVHRTLYKDGYFNTLCLPFNVPDIEDSPLAGAEVFTFDGGTVTGHETYDEQLSLEVSPLVGRTLTRGVPYLLRWPDNGEVMTMLRFDGVTNWAEANSMEEATSNDPGNENIKYHGLYPRRHIPSYMTGEEPHYNFFVDVENSLYWPDDQLYPDSKMKGFRAYFYLQGGGPEQSDPHNAAARYRNMPSSWRIRSTATDLENVQGDDVPCTKVIKNGVLVIRHSGKEYNILGEMIK